MDDEEAAALDFRQKIKKASHCKLMVHAMASTAPDCKFLIGARVAGTGEGGSAPAGSLSPSKEGRRSGSGIRDKSPGVKSERMGGGPRDHVT